MATSVSLGYCGWLAGATWSDTVGRNMTAGLTAMGATRGGVLPNVSQALQILSSSGMNATCNPGSAIIPAATVAAGPYIPVNSVVQTLTHNAADPTNPRIDRWMIQVVDNGNNTSFGQIVIVAGTPAASPSPPAVPTGALSLAQVRINAGVSSFNQANVTDERIYTATAGGIILCPNMASLPVGWPGLLGYDLTNNRIFALTATGAQPIHVLGAPPALAIKTTNSSAPSGSETTLLSVNLPPTVFLTTNLLVGSVMRGTRSVVTGCTSGCTSTPRWFRTTRSLHFSRRRLTATTTTAVRS